MNTKKPLLIAAVVSSIGLAGFIGISTVSAATPTKPDSLASSIATKFHLNVADVQSVFNEHKSEREASREANLDKHLSEEVTKGKLTDSQKSLIIAERQKVLSEVQTNIASTKNKTPADKRAAAKALRSEVEKWATDNNIPKKYIHLVLRMEGHERER